MRSGSRARRLVVSALVVSALLGACGGEGGVDITDGNNSSSDAVAVDIALVINSTGTTGGDRTGSVTCQAGRAIGTGWFLDDARATAVCKTLRSSPALVTRLVSGPPPSRGCTQQYGGPQQARVEGKILGDLVQATISRTDGCGIADWTALQVLLGPP